MPDAKLLADTLTDKMGRKVFQQSTVCVCGRCSLGVGGKRAPRGFSCIFANASMATRTAPEMDDIPIMPAASVIRVHMSAAVKKLLRDLIKI